MNTTSGSRPSQQRAESAQADRDGLLAQQLAGRGATAATVCERVWVSAPSTIMALVLLYLDRDGHLADTACWRRCHASIKSRQTSPTGDERQNKRKSRPSRPTASMRASSPPGRDLFHHAGRHRQRIETASLVAVAR